MSQSETLKVTVGHLRWAHNNLGNVIEKMKKLYWDTYDRGGVPYENHLRFVAEAQDQDRTGAAAHDSYGMVLGWCHDAFEDGKLTAEQLLEEGWPCSIVARLQILTKRPDESYELYIMRILTDDYCINVKEADLRHNMQLHRLPSLSGKDLPRLKKYVAAYQTIQEAIHARQHRSNTWKSEEVDSATA